MSSARLKSTHLTEAIARGFGVRTNAALQKQLRGSAEGRYIRFDETAFSRRLLEFTGSSGPEGIDLPPLWRSACYIENLFDKPHIEILEIHPHRARFRLAGIPDEITIVIEDLDNGYFRSHRSHAIHTPEQIDPYWPSRDFDDDPASVMHRAIESILKYYDMDVREGQEAKVACLVVSKY